SSLGGAVRWVAIGWNRRCRLTQPIIANRSRHAYTMVPFRSGARRAHIWRTSMFKSNSVLRFRAAHPTVKSWPPGDDAHHKQHNLLEGVAGARQSLWRCGVVATSENWRGGKLWFFVVFCVPRADARGSDSHPIAR